MGLNFKIQIRNEKIAEHYGLSTQRKYAVDMMDHESYYIRHPYNDEKVEINFKDAEEFRPEY